MKTFEELASLSRLVQEPFPDRLLKEVDRFKRNFINIENPRKEFYNENSNNTL